MTRIARLVLLVVLALAVPFHAAYAVGMAQCAARAHGTAHSMAQSAPSAHEAQAPCEHGGANPVAADPDDKKSDSSGSHCSACSACGTAIAITGGVASPFVMVGASSYLSCLETRLDGVTPSRLDRPPLPL